MGLLQLAMTCALMASSSFLQFANYMAWPVSTTHSIVGGVMGTGIAAFGSAGILWDFSNCAGVQYDSSGNTIACTTPKKIDGTGNNQNSNALDQIPSNGVRRPPRAPAPVACFAAAARRAIAPAAAAHAFHSPPASPSPPPHAPPHSLRPSQCPGSCRP